MNEDNVLTNVANLFKALIPKLKGDGIEVAQYALARARNTASLVGDPNYVQALAADKDSVILHGAVAIALEGDALDEKTNLAITSLLDFATNALAKLAGPTLTPNT